MSPLDMLIFLFFILVTIKAATSCIDHWRDIDEAAERAASRRVIKRVNAPAASVRNTTIARQTPLKDKGAA